MNYKNDNGCVNNTKNEKNKKVIRYTVIITGIIIALVIGISVVGGISETNDYLKEVRVCNASISERTSDSGKYYLRLTLKSNKPTDYIKADDLWIEVKSEFYFAHVLNTDIGVLLGNYDEYKTGIFDKKQQFQKNIWGINDVYNTVGDAQEANPQKNYTDTAKLNKKKTTKTGETFFVLAKDERTFIVKVEKEIYDKYDVNSEVECEYESIGEMIKLTKVIG